MTLWTKKHTTFSVQNRLTPTARELWQWLLDEIPEGIHDTVDLREYNQWVEDTRGKPHDPKTVRSAMEQLLKVGVLIHARPYTRHVWKWTLRSIDLLMPPTPRPIPKKSTPAPEIPKTEASSECSSTTSNNSSSPNLVLAEGKEAEEILAECEAAGIPFVKKERLRVLEYPLHQVKLALAYFQYRFPDELSRLEIRSYQGMLIHFLKEHCWNWNRNFLRMVDMSNLVPEWVKQLCAEDDVLELVYY